jgi:hypothetical protein
MNLQKITTCFLFSFLLHSANAFTLFPADTIRMKPFVRKMTPYPQQPIILKINTLSVLWGPVPLTAEYRLTLEMPSSKNQAMQLGLSFLGKSPIWAMVEKQTKTGFHPLDFVVTGVSVQIANKFYLVPKKFGSPFGYYIAPQVSYSNAHISLSKSRAYRQTYIDATQFSVGFIIGRQLARGKAKRFTTDAYVGAGYKNNTWIYHANTFTKGPYDTSDFPKYFHSHVKLTAGINLGWAIH